MRLKTFSEFTSNNTHTFRELLPNKSKHIFRVHIKHYWHFEKVTPKQYYTLFQTSINTDIFESYSQTILYTFPDIKQYWNFQRVTGKQYYTLFQSSSIKQYLHFQRAPSKLNYSRKFFQSSYHTILTLSENY